MAIWMPDMVNFISVWVMVIVLKICDAHPEQRVGLIIPHYWDNALPCVWLSIWLVGIDIIPDPVTVPGTATKNPLEWLFTHSQVVSLFLGTGQASKWKQLQNLFPPSLSGMIILWCPVSWQLLSHTYFFPLITFILLHRVWKWEKTSFLKAEFHFIFFFF